MRHGLAVALLAASAALPPGYWPVEKTGPILEKTQTMRLAPELSALTAGERTAMAKLLEVGGLVQRLYEAQRHHQALEAHAGLEALHARGAAPAATRNLLDVYRLFHGPIAVTLENRREPFVPVDATVPGRNVYPWGVSREEVEAFLAREPARRNELLDARTVVRRATAEDLARDAATLARHPALDTLHPGLRQRLLALAPGDGFYAVPYAVAYAEELLRAHRLLAEAAAAVEGDDRELALYLRHRGRDLLANDYEAGDASWVTGRFRRLNAQIGAYETYDDELFGVKAFHALSLLLRNEAESAALQKATGGLQQIQDLLPSPQKRTVRRDVPVGVYDVIADFGQARGTNTATILPNEAYLARRYGRTILLRANLMRHPDLFADQRAAWEAALAPAHGGELVPEGNFYRTLWHEIGHYLGVDATRDGRELNEALQEHADLLEEMKADLVSLYAGEPLRARGYYEARTLRALYASGVRRVLNTSRPRPDQPYQRMQLVQFNWFLEKGAFAFDPGASALSVRYDRFRDAVGSLLGEVLRLQHEGDAAAAGRFVERYSAWEPDLHEALATRIRGSQRYRFRLVRYAALGE